MYCNRVSCVRLLHYGGVYRCTRKVSAIDLKLLTRFSLRVLILVLGTIQVNFVEAVAYRRRLFLEMGS